MRTLILLSAMCILLLVGYSIMGKDNIFDTHAILKKVRELTSLSAQKQPVEDSETSKDVVDTLLNGAKSEPEKEGTENLAPNNSFDEFEEVEDTANFMPATEIKEKKDVTFQEGNIELPFLDYGQDTSFSKSEERKIRQWELLEDTHRVLADVGEILK